MIDQPRRIGLRIVGLHEIVGAGENIVDAGPARVNDKGRLEFVARLHGTAQECLLDVISVAKALLFGAMGARNGVNAALVVHSGWTGVDDILSGPTNFVESYNPKADPAGLIDHLGEVYGVTLTTLKKWTTGGPIQAPLDALEIRQRRQPFQADQVKQVVARVATSAAYTVNNRDMPDICLQHLVAVMLLDKTVSFRAAHDKARMQDPSVLRERAKVQLVPDEE